MTDSTSEQESARDRLVSLVSRLSELGDPAYASDPDFAHLIELERAVQAEVDRIVVEQRERGNSFKSIAVAATYDWRNRGRRSTQGASSAGQSHYRPERAEPWQRWRSRYRAAVKRLCGADEEVLTLEELKQRRQQIKDLETQLRVGPRPAVERSADNQSETSIRVSDLRRGDCIADGPARIVVRTESGVNPEGKPYVLVTYHDGMEYPYWPDHLVDFGREAHIFR